MTVQERVLVDFALMWAPYGGSPPEDLFVTFGVTSKAFVEMVESILTTSDSDQSQAPEMKSRLLDDLVRAWRPMRSTRKPRARG